MLWYYYDDVDDELNLNNLLFIYLFLNLRILKYDIIVMYFVFLILNKYIWMVIFFYCFCSFN